MHLESIEMADADFSVQELKKQLFTSLKCTGILDSLKSQLRARLLDHLKKQDGNLLENKDKNRKPSVTERLLSSLFLDYLNSYGYAFTQSVFLPESRMVSWPPYSSDEILQLLHLDVPPSFINRQLKFDPDGRSCLMQQLVVALQKISFHMSTQDASVQTQDLDSCLREIDDACHKRQKAERQLASHSLENRFNNFRQEYETRINGEVELQVNRIREYETNALRVEEACRYRRQLAKDREELEELHKARLERIREREEVLTERLIVKEKAIETSAYEQRQKLLVDITNLRDREDKLKEREQQQVRHSEKLAEHEKCLKEREEDIRHMRETLYARADESLAVKLKELEDHYKCKHVQLQSEWALLEARWAAFHEEKSKLANELREANVDREMVMSLHERLAALGEERQLLLDQIENKCQQQEVKWSHEQKKMQKTTNRLEADLKKMEEEKERAVLNRQALQVQLRHSESELLDMVTLLKKTQHVLEMERLHHYSLRSQIANFFSNTSTSEDKPHKTEDRASLSVSKALQLKAAMPGNTRHFEYPGRDQATSPLDAGNFLPETRRHQPSSSESQTTTRSKTQNVTLLRSSSGKIPAEDGKPASGWYHLSTNRDELRGHEHRNPPSGGVRRVSLNSPQEKESSSVHHLSSSSKEKHENSSEGRKRRTENEQDRERAEKNSSSSSEVSSFTSRKSFKELAMAGLPEKSRKESQKSKEKTPGVTSWESTQSSTDYYMLGVTSMKSNTSATEFKIMGKSVKTSTSLDYDNKERRRTEVYEAKFQQNIKKINMENERNDGNSQEAFRQQTTSLLSRSQGHGQSSRMIYEDKTTGGTTTRDLSPTAGGRSSPIRVEEVKAKKDEPRSYQGSFEIQGHQDQIPVTTSNLGTHIRPGIAAHTSLEKSRASGEDVQFSLDHAECHISANDNGLSVMVVQDFGRFSQKLEVTKSLTALEGGPDFGSVEQQNVTEFSGLGVKVSGYHHRENNQHGKEEMEFPGLRQLLKARGSTESGSPATNAAVVAHHKEATNQNEATLKHEWNGSVCQKEPSLSTADASGKTLPHQQVARRRFSEDNNGGDPNSEESCSNPTARAQTVRNPADLGVDETTQEEPQSCLQRTQEWDIQSEQGSHNPDEEGAMECVDHYASGNSDHYVDYSDTFSVPENNSTPTNESASARFP
ncbi:hypothetical protein R1sor_007316 [Riccia sorocarpa]|uniref:LisH domain-containing protein n=1 Tax=Riccia sorocarpa TaxID=122646 RepID=A0ABD3HUA5_9MARC